MKGRSPFKRAIPQSPGFTPTRWNNYTDQTFHAFMGVYANVSSLAELRNLDSVALMEANAHQVFDTQIIGSFTYGPVVDGDFVPDLPGVLFASGRFDQGVEVMAGHNAREGGFFTDPTLRNDSELIRQIETALGASPQVAEYIASELYPAIYNGTQPYGNWYERAMLITTEFAFICNNFYMLSATSSQSYGYLFNVFPGFHGQDVAYTFYAGTDPTNATSANFQDFVQVQYPDAAYTLQDWIVTFAMGSSPLTIVPGSPNLPLYDGGGQIGTLNGAAGMFAASLGKEPADNERCRWWQQGLYAPPL
jgi:carboxylesterase type B